MALNNISTTVRNAMCDAMVDAIDTGTTDTGGDIQGHTTAFGTLLFELEFTDPAFGAAAAGVATAAAISDDPDAAATGVAAVCRIRDRDNATVVEGSVGSGSGDLDLNTTSITINDIVAITAATITMPAS